jgi:hypothetical protein
MPEFVISYQTQNTYSETMKRALLEFLILPANCEKQERMEYSLEVKPFLNPYFSKNSFGFELIQFGLKQQQQCFSLKLTSRVFKDEFNPFYIQPLSAKSEKMMLNSNEFAVENYPFMQETVLTQLPLDYNYPTIGCQESVFEYLSNLNHFIHAEFKYDLSDTNTQKNITQTINERKGVCQDFAHFMIAVLRKNKIPARYVSGYLNQGAKFIGSGAVHAWVQALIPGTGWVGFDPTNNLLEDYHYIKIAHGVDINDCLNVKGVITGPGTNDTNYSVLVEEQNKQENQ